MSKVYRILLILALSLVMAACAAAPDTPPESEAPQPPADTPAQATNTPTSPEASDTDAMDSKYNEAPEMAALVAAGQLPPVEERLPLEPFVVGPGVLIAEADLPDWQVGKYGGTIRGAHSVPDWAPDIFVFFNEPLLSAPGLSVQDIRGNILRDFEVNDDNTEFTFYMREGLKWHTGEAVTSEDVRFTYEDVMLNENINPVFPAWARNGGDPAGDPMQLEIIDDFTFKVTFTEPNGGFLRRLVIEGWSGYPDLLKPAYYMKQFHADYTPLDELRPLLDEQGLEDEWWQLFTAKDCRHWDQTRPRCIDFPVLTPWHVVDSEPGIMVFERNPYYYKVDTAGNQLPYVGHVVSVQSEDVEAVNLKLLTGEVDFLRESTGLVKIPLYKENEEQAGFTVHLLDMHVDSSNLKINQTFDDPVWQEVAQDVRFRQALSLAINRDEIIESAYYSFASYPMVSVGEELSQYDPERANQLLDEIGLDQRDSDGFRIGPDGETFSILLEQAAHAPDIAPVAEIITEYLRDVGLNVQMKQIDTTLFGQRNTANELQMSVMWSHDANSDNGHTSSAVTDAGRLWNNWHTSNGQEGVEPPDWVKEAWELDATRWSAAVPGSDEYNQLREEGFAWHRENLPMITIVEQVKYPMVASSDLRNIPIGGYAIAANFSAEQLFYENPDMH